MTRKRFRKPIDRLTKPSVEDSGRNGASKAGGDWSVTPSLYGPHQMGPIDGAHLSRERWREMIGLTIRLVVFVILMSVIVMAVFSVFGIILLFLVAAPVLFLFALL